MADVVADTHAVVWWLIDQGRLSEAALRVLDAACAEGSPIRVSAISLVEVIYLVEKGRLPALALDRLVAALHEPAPPVSLVPVDAAVAEKLRDVSRAAVPDMPDRIIVATALHLRLPLVTRDGAIRASGADVVW